MINQTLSGVIVPVVTPLDDQDRVADADFRSVLRRLMPTGVNGLFIGGSAGEGPLLTIVEWAHMVEIAFDECRGGSPLLLGGVMETSTQRVIEKIKILKQIGYQYYVLTPPFYFSLKAVTEHLRLFEACKEHDGGMDLIAYNLPGVTGSAIPIEALCEGARRGWLRWAKESSGDLGYFRKLIIAGRDVGLQAFMGDELGILEGLHAGACGIVPVCANYEPETYVGIYRAALAQNDAELERLYARNLELRQKLPLAGTYWVAGLKYALACLGIGSGKPVSPMEPLTPEQQTQIHDFVRQSAVVAS